MFIVAKIFYLLWQNKQYLCCIRNNQYHLCYLILKQSWCRPVHFPCGHEHSKQVSVPAHAQAGIDLDLGLILDCSLQQHDALFSGNALVEHALHPLSRELWDWSNGLSPPSTEHPAKRLNKLHQGECIYWGGGDSYIMSQYMCTYLVDADS